MIEISSLRLARSSRNWLSDTEFAVCAVGYARQLREQGYAKLTVQTYLEGIAHFAHWCFRKHIGLHQINEEVVKRFLERHLPLCRCAERCQRTRHSVEAALSHLIAFLRTEAQIAPKRSVDPAAISLEIRSFEHHLMQVCGVGPTTCAARSKHVRAFLLDRFTGRRARISLLQPADVIQFLKKYTRGWKPSSKRDVHDSLRSFFRFKAVDGEQVIALSAAIPKVAQWRLAQLPKGVTADQVVRLLKAFDRSYPTGKRDYAITRCFVDLGLRTTEVARLSLDDIDWRQGVLHIRGKGRRVDILPLPQATGRAIVDYIRHGRPQSRSRALFLRHCPPLDTSATPSVARAAVRRAAARCGVERCLQGPQVLRHTLAQRLVQSGTPLKQIADLLRHRSLDTTTIYAKVDLTALSQVALPWPGRKP